MSNKKQHQMDKPQLQYQAYCEIERCTNAHDLNIAIKRYFYGFIGEIHYGKYHGDLVYDKARQQFQLKRYTFDYSKDIDMPYAYIQSLYLAILANWLPNGYYEYRQHLN